MIEVELVSHAIDNFHLVVAGDDSRPHYCVDTSVRVREGEDQEVDDIFIYVAEVPEHIAQSLLKSLLVDFSDAKHAEGHLEEFNEEEQVTREGVVRISVLIEECLGELALLQELLEQLGLLAPS